MSLQDRIAELQKNSLSWKERVEKPQDSSSPATLSTVKTLLTTSQTTWKARVGQKDAHLFTVNGKLQRDKISIQEFKSDKDKPPVVIEHESFYLPHSYNPNDSHFKSFFPKEVQDSERVEIDLDVEIPIINPLPVSKTYCFARPRKPVKKVIAEKQSTTTVVAKALQSTCSYNIPLKTPQIKKETKKLYKIKGRKRPIPIQIEIKVSNLSNHDCFVLRTEDTVYCFYGEYANLLEKTKCDEFFVYFGEKACRVYYQGSNWRAFLKEFPPAGGGGEEDELDEGDPGDEGDLRYENEVLIKMYEWDGAGWVGAEMEWELTEVKGPRIFDFGTELYFYTDPLQKANLPEATLEVFRSEKYLTFKKIKKNLEPIEFRTKFNSKIGKKPKSSRGGRTNHSTSISTTSEISSIWETQLTLDSIPFNNLTNITSDDPTMGRSISTSTITLTKTKITLNVTTTDFDLLTFYTTDCYLIHWTYRLTYTTHRLVKSQPSSTTEGRERTCWFCWYGSKCNPLDRGRLSTLFSLKGNFESVFGITISSEGEKVSVEEGSEPGIFLELVGGAKFFRGINSDIFERKIHEGVSLYTEVDEFYEDGEYFDGELERLVPDALLELDFDDFFVAFSLEDYFQEYFCYTGSYLIKFLKDLDSGEGKLEREFDFRIFKDFYPMGEVGTCLGKDIVEDKFKMSLEEFGQLAGWRKKLLTKGVFYK
ncbi:Supervillin [Folsomia candida]|uniref:Supervillin n=1 Tax=Folsomia candida TaxID=158441 RepID=A0A226EG26_FOLCA|nr:Supervillin [Folsomia candida]